MTTVAKSLANRKQHLRERGVPKYETAYFVAWDGEGITDPVTNEHRYVILANSEGDEIVNPNGLSTEDCFELMLRVSARLPQAVHVIFAGSYDACMILKPALQARPPIARRLNTLSRCTLRLGDKRYSVMYRPRHEFVVKEQHYDADKGKLITDRSITIWDVFGSFQSSFVEACRTRLPEADVVDLLDIDYMKSQRSNFTTDDIPRMLIYCRQELKALKRLQEIDYEDTKAAGIVKMTRWDGAGPKSAILLQQHDVKAHKATHPDSFKLPITCAYAGGRSELLRFGDYLGPCWQLDIKSAYPWASTKLPSLANGRWDVGTETGPKSVDEYSLWYVHYAAENIDGLHPFFYRTKQGAVGFPALAEGWYWAPEVWAALQACPERVQIIDGYVFQPATDYKPFGWMPEVFEARKRLDAMSKGRGTPLKLAYNSTYGKLAQQQGGGMGGRIPPYHQLDWAGWITSRVRAEMFMIGWPRQKDVIGIQTDGIMILGEPDVTHNLGDGLGQYDVTTYVGGTWVQAGVYWLKKDENTWEHPKSRGVSLMSQDNLANLVREQFVQTWRDGTFFKKVKIKQTRFRGLSTSIMSRGRWKDFCKWIPENRYLYNCPPPGGKRLHGDQCDMLGLCDDRLHGTLPVSGGVSHPYRLKWERIGRWSKWVDEDESTDSGVDDAEW